MGEITGVAPVFADLPNEEEAEAVAAVAGAAVRRLRRGPHLLRAGRTSWIAPPWRPFSPCTPWTSLSTAGFKAVGVGGQSRSRVLLEQHRRHPGSVRSCSRARLQEHRVLVERHGVRRAGVRAHHRKLPEATTPPTPMANGPNRCWGRSFPTCTRATTSGTALQPHRRP